MTPQEETQVRRWNDGLAGEVRFRLITTSDPQSRELEKFCEDLSRCASNVSIHRETGSAEEGMPAIILNEKIRFHAVPLERELEPFLQALAGEYAGIPDDLTKSLAQVRIPALLKLYIAPQCPHCPAVVRLAVRLAGAGEMIRVSVIDAGLFNEAAQADDVRSVPTLILDNDFRWTGAVKPDEILGVMMTRNPARLSAASLEQIIAEGDAARIARMMDESNQIFPAFVEILLHPEWPVRLGAMVAAETLAEQNPELAASLPDILRDRFEAAENAVRGDILYLCGATGDRSILPFLEHTASGPYDADVQEAAIEAIEALAERYPA